MYDELLLPADGSPAVEAALPHALGLAELYDATIHVLYVADTDRDSLSVIGGEVYDALEQEGISVVDELVERIEARGIDCIGTVAQGGPREGIIEYVEENDIDAVVMATHGRHGVERLLLGSVTEHVVRTSPVPVLTVRVTE
ncbi:universal stress protein [Haloferax namakaokahaiae]|uniref:Universal stress protein n=1 Tax=Haloferax namakaokahaiae TaxID=1748331 RepID=A0ABD5ZFB7_9EURY